MTSAPLAHVHSFAVLGVGVGGCAPARPHATKESDAVTTSMNTQGFILSSDLKLLTSKTPADFSRLLLCGERLVAGSLREERIEPDEDARRARLDSRGGCPCIVRPPGRRRYVQVTRICAGRTCGLRCGLRGWLAPSRRHPLKRILRPRPRSGRCPRSR